MSFTATSRRCSIVCASRTVGTQCPRGDVLQARTRVANHRSLHILRPRTITASGDVASDTSLHVAARRRPQPRGHGVPTVRISVPRQHEFPGQAKPSIPQHRIRIHRRPFPPLLLRRQRHHRKMQMRRIRIRIPARPHIPDHIPALDLHAFLHTLRIPL